MFIDFYIHIYIKDGKKIKFYIPFSEMNHYLEITFEGRGSGVGDVLSQYLFLRWHFRKRGGGGWQIKMWRLGQVYPDVILTSQAFIGKVCRPESKGP